jgi:endonuclease/exonuclease/phosphatase family metal-dependent hydrolase
MTLTCATYNILHGYHRDMVLKNIRFLIKEGADVICLQEVEVPFEPALKQFLAQKEFVGWQMRCAHAGYGGNVAILWRSGKLRYKKAAMVRLPKLKAPTNLRRHVQVKRLRKFDTNRVALVAYFEAGGTVFQITSVHLAWEGGSRHRMNQLRHLRHELEKTPADVRLVMGDFNTLAPMALRRVHERRVEQTLGSHYVNALPRLKWSYDTSHADPRDGLGFLPALHRAGVTFRTRLDYIFGKGVSVISGHMHDLPGSDHRPLVAVFAPATARGKSATLLPI